MSTDIQVEKTNIPGNLRGAETRIQADVLRTLSGGDNAVVMRLIDKLSPELRAIITDFQKRNGRLPTTDEIIWIVGEHHNLDPRHVARLLEDATDMAAIETGNPSSR